MGVGGPMPVRGLNDELYFNMARCRCLGHRVIYFMKTKDEIASTGERYLLDMRAFDKSPGSPAAPSTACPLSLSTPTSSTCLVSTSPFRKLRTAESEYGLQNFTESGCGFRIYGIEVGMYGISRGVVFVLFLFCLEIADSTLTDSTDSRIPCGFRQKRSATPPRRSRPAPGPSPAPGLACTCSRIACSGAFPGCPGVRFRGVPGYVPGAPGVLPGSQNALNIP
jgi:hypothetical protein